MNGKRKIKVLEIIQQGKIGGGESHLLTLLQFLDRDEFEPVVIALSDGEMMPRLTEMGVRNYVVNSPYPFNPLVRREIKKILKEEEPDLIHTHGARSISNIFGPARQKRIPVVHTVHGWSFHDFMPRWKKRLRIAGEKYLTAKAAVVIAVSASNKEIGEELFGLRNCVVVNNGIDLARYKRQHESPVRKEFSIPQEALVVSFIARFIHDKNPLPLLKAFTRLRKDHPRLYLLMAGDGPAREETMQEARNAGVSDFIRFPGFRSDIPELLGAADIFCLPSIKEGLPVSLIEAMAMQNAVVATAVQGCTDVITHEVDGLLVPLQDLEQSLYEALTRLTEDETTRLRLSREGVRTVENRFSAEKMTAAICDIYRSVSHTSNQPL